MNYTPMTLIIILYVYSKLQDLVITFFNFVHTYI